MRAVTIERCSYPASFLSGFHQVPPRQRIPCQRNFQLRQKEIITRLRQWDLLGVGAVAYDRAHDRIVIEWHAEPRHCHSTEGHPRGGIVQGGIVTGWLDATMATASLLRGEYQIAVASLEVKVSFLLSAHPGRYKAYAKVLRQGRTISFLEAELRDANDTLIATATSTAALRSRNPAPAHQA